MAVGWPHEQSPFHRGELAVQERLGLRDEVEPFARRMVRDFLPDQHRTFYGALPFLLLGGIDLEGFPWATIVFGQPGFVSSPDERTLTVAARPIVGDPLLADLQPGADIGVLGIELETRRRNRATGRITHRGQDGLSIAIDQSFGNCPQYIQTRTVEALPADRESGTGQAPILSDRFDDATARLLGQADTFFIATAFRGAGTESGQGADVSHRGGLPGFVRLEDDRTFSFPDFPGNRHFNTLGNIHLNPNAGFLFVDFTASDRTIGDNTVGAGAAGHFNGADLVYMTGAAEILWDDREDGTYAGAGRRIRFRVRKVVRIPQGAPLRFTFGDYSPAHGRLSLREE